MIPQQIVIDQGIYGTAWYSLPILTARAFRGAGIETPVVSLAAQRSGRHNDYYGCDVGYHEDFSSASFCCEPTKPRDCLKVYSWLRELLKRHPSLTVIHSFGDTILDRIIAPLVYEFGVEWNRHAYAMTCEPPVLYRDASLSAELLNHELAHLACLCVKLRTDDVPKSLFTIVLPPLGELTSIDLETAAMLSGSDATLAFLEPCPIPSSHAPFDSPVGSLTPDTEEELVALFYATRQCIVPESGSWLTEFASNAGCAPIFVRPVNNLLTTQMTKDGQ